MICAWKSWSPLCRQAGVRVRQESREQLTLLAKTPAHQGVVALVRPSSLWPSRISLSPTLRVKKRLSPPATGS